MVCPLGHRQKYLHLCQFSLICMESYNHLFNIASSFVSNIIRISMLLLTLFTRSSNFDLIEFILIWSINIRLTLLIRSDFNSSPKYLDSTFTLLEGKVVESLSVVSLSDWFNKLLSHKLSLPTGLSDSYHLNKLVI